MLLGPAITVRINYVLELDLPMTTIELGALVMAGVCISNCVLRAFSGFSELV